MAKLFLAVNQRTLCICEIGTVFALLAFNYGNIFASSFV